MKRSDYTEQYQKAFAEMRDKDETRSIEDRIKAVDWSLEYAIYFEGIQKYTRKFMDDKVKESAVPPKEKLTTATLAVEELEESDRDRIINEYNRSAQGLGNAQRRLARASKQLDDFNKR
jgi:hypothetical protein